MVKRYCLMKCDGEGNTKIINVPGLGVPLFVCETEAASFIRNSLNGYPFVSIISCFVATNIAENQTIDVLR